MSSTKETTYKGSFFFSIHKGGKTMASNIKGITIEIGGNTSKLQDALKGVNKTIYSCNS
jgi:hypothetical protein